MTELKDFKYQRLTPHQLIKLVYELNKALVEATDRLSWKDLVQVKDPAFMEISEKAQKVINRARLEGIL